MASSAVMKKTALLLLCLLASAAAAARPPADCGAVEAEAFSVLPMLLPAGRGGRQGVSYCLSNLRADAVEVWNGAGGFGSPKRLPVRESGFSVSAGKSGNYHWLQATENSELGIITASTAHYFSAPGQAPTAMLQLPKTELEIVPQPLPREHWRYRAGETWEFLVRFQGEPLKDAEVRLKTSGGARREYRTDERGIARVYFPLDGAGEAHAGGHDHGRSQQDRFVLTVDLKGPDGRRYLTAFNHHYGPPASAGRSLPFGLGFLALGGLIALPLAMRRKEGKHG